MDRQYGQYDFEKTTTLLSSIIFWALSFAPAIAAGDMDGEPKNRRRRVVAKAMMGDLCKCSCRMEEGIKVVCVHNYLAYERVRD